MYISHPNDNHLKALIFDSIAPGELKDDEQINQEKQYKVWNLEQLKQKEEK